MVAKSERFELRLDIEILDRIDNWRSQQSDIPSRSEAVRRLVEYGLGRPEDTALFQIARFNVLVAAKTQGPTQSLSSAYVYAWDNGVYPLFHDGSHLHQPFASQFAVTMDMVDELSKYLGDCWEANDVPTFYKVEDYYKVRSARTAWDRASLIRTCRYMFLQRMFDEKFWNSLIKGSSHPTEAKSIIRKFSFDEIFLN